MGQAKLKGSKEERIAKAKARIDAIRPVSIDCNKCKSTINEVHELNIRGIHGLDGAFAVHCNTCNCDTFAIKGTPEAMIAVTEAMQRTSGNNLEVATQPIRR